MCLEVPTPFLICIEHNGEDAPKDMCFACCFHCTSCVLFCHLHTGTKSAQQDAKKTFRYVTVACLVTSPYSLMYLKESSYYERFPEFRVCIYFFLRCLYHENLSALRLLTRQHFTHGNNYHF